MLETDSKDRASLSIMPCEGEGRHNVKSGDHGESSQPDIIGLVRRQWTLADEQSQHICSLSCPAGKSAVPEVINSNVSKWRRENVSGYCMVMTYHFDV